MLAKISLCTACQVLLTLFPQKYSLESGVYLYVDKNLPYNYKDFHGIISNGDFHALRGWQEFSN